MAAERDERMAKRRIDVSPFLTLPILRRKRKISATLGLWGTAIKPRIVLAGPQSVCQASSAKSGRSPMRLSIVAERGASVAHGVGGFRHTGPILPGCPRLWHASGRTRIFSYGIIGVLAQRLPQDPGVPKRTRGPGRFSIQVKQGQRLGGWRRFY